MFSSSCRINCRKLWRRSRRIKIDWISVQHCLTISVINNVESFPIFLCSTILIQCKIRWNSVSLFIKSIQTDLFWHVAFVNVVSLFCLYCRFICICFCIHNIYISLFSKIPNRQSGIPSCSASPCHFWSFWASFFPSSPKGPALSSPFPPFAVCCRFPPHSVSVLLLVVVLFKDILF